MNEVNLAQLDIFTYNELLDQRRFETWQILALFIHKLNELEGIQGFVSSVLTLPDGFFCVLLTDDKTSLMQALAISLGMTPIDIQNWLNQFIDSESENVVELSQDESPIALDVPDETKELVIPLLETDTQTDSDEKLFNPDYPDDNPLDNDEP